MYAFLPVESVKDLVPLARELGISEIARSPKGFVPAYIRAGSPDKLSKKWLEIRENLIRRHVAQAEAGHEQWWALNVPTRRHLALIMWAYSPDPERLLRFLQGRKT